jgi:hypothetical protein
MALFLVLPGGGVGFAVVASPIGSAGCFNAGSFCARPELLRQRRSFGSSDGAS